jgi:hypothetical protein
MFFDDMGAGIMGFLHYGHSDFAIEMDDRSLAHLKVVILTLLRDGQSTAFSFTHSAQQGPGRETVWIHPATDIRFEFFGSRPAQLNRRWVEAMLRTASGPTGLHLTEEPLEEVVSVAGEAADLRRLQSLSG